MRASNTEILKNLEHSKLALNSASIAKSKEFLNFKKLVYAEVEKEEDETEKIEEEKRLKS